MDTWMVAVAAGAGYIAQHFKDLKRGGGRNASESSSSENPNTIKPESPKQPPNKKCPFRRSVNREKSKGSNSEAKNDVSQGVSNTEATFIGDFHGEKGANLDNFQDTSVFSSSSLFPGFIGSDGGLWDVERMGDLLPKPSATEVGPSYGLPSSPRHRSVLRSRRVNGRSIRPVSSLESCLMAQLYKEHVEREEYLLRSFAPPPMQTVRPFFVTDGTKLISRASGDAFAVQNNNMDKKPSTYSEGNGVVSGVPPLPNTRSLKIRGKDDAKTRKERRGRLSYSSAITAGEHFRFPRGSSDATLLLCLGISFGIISSFVANKREFDKLNGLLKQTENLVQDLQEELEMKDSLIVQELTFEGHDSQQMRDDSFERSLGTSTDFGNGEFVGQKAKDDSMSKIEAELEAELEMLELNMTSSTLEGRFSNLVEIGPDFVPDVAHGDLKADVFSNEAYADRDGSGSTTAHSANYAVSPRELSLRLHELLESQLEKRIKELEAEIKNKHIRNPEPFQDFSSGDGNPVDEPVVLNLSGEALDAYNEAYEEFSKIDESEDEGESENGELPRNSDQTPADFGDDEMEKLLIKHLVEKARKGSPVVLNAQRALFSMESE